MAKMNLKFKDGDVVRITNDTTFHGFAIGSHVTIERIHDWGNGLGNGFFSYMAIDSEGDLMSFDDDDCEAIQGVLQ